jgi:hypothetical protein
LKSNVKAPPSVAPLADEPADRPPTTDTAAPGDAGAAGNATCAAAPDARASIVKANVEADRYLNM